MSGWMTACVSPCTVTANPATASSSPADTAVNWPGCSPNRPASAAGAYTRNSGRAASASLIAAWCTWSKCSWVIRIASAPLMMPAASAENEPGSMTKDAPSFSKTTHACSCLVSFTATGLLCHPVSIGVNVHGRQYATAMPAHARAASAARTPVAARTSAAAATTARAARPAA